MKTDNFVQGATAPQEFQLMTVAPDGIETPFDATDGGGVVPLYDIALILKTAAGGSVTLLGPVVWSAPATGKVRYTPDAADLSAASSPYTARFKVTDSALKTAFFPDGIADRWVVRL